MWTEDQLDTAQEKTEFYRENLREALLRAGAPAEHVRDIWLLCRNGSRECGYAYAPALFFVDIPGLKLERGIFSYRGVQLEVDIPSGVRFEQREEHLINVLPSDLP